MKKLVCCMLLFLVLIPPFALCAQDEEDYLVQANIIFRFTKYIDWPAEKKSGDFVIGVVGSYAMLEHLKSFIGNKTVGNQKIVVQQFDPSASTYNCSILFIGEESNRYFKKIVSATEGLSVLLVSEGEDLAKKGSCINFNIESEHLKLEINKDNIEGRNLDIAGELLSLGVLVK